MNQQNNYAWLHRYKPTYIVQYVKEFTLYVMWLVNDMKTMETNEWFKKVSNPTSKRINNRFLFLWSHHSALYDLVQKCIEMHSNTGWKCWCNKKVKCMNCVCEKIYINLLSQICNKHKSKDNREVKY